MAENQGPLLLWVSVALTVLSPGCCCTDCKTNGSVSLCPSEYLVPTSPPLSPFCFRCSYAHIIQHGGTLEAMDVLDGDCCTINGCLNIDPCLVFGRSLANGSLQIRRLVPANVAQRLILREDFGAMFIEGTWSPPLLQEVTKPWRCKYVQLDANSVRSNPVTESAVVDVVVPAESGNVSITISPDQSLFAESDLVQVQCVGVVGIKWTNHRGHLVLQRYSHAASDWIVINTQTQDNEFPHDVLGTRIQEILDVTLLVSNILEASGSCQVTLRCFLDYPNYKNYIDRAQTKVVRVNPGSGGCTGNETPPTPTPGGTTPKKAGDTGDIETNNKEASVESNTDNGLLIVLATAGGVLLLAALTIGTVFVVQKRNARRGRSSSLPSRHSLQSQMASQQFQEFKPVVIMSSQEQEPGTSDSMADSMVDSMADSMADSETDPGGSYNYSEASSFDTVYPVN